MSATAIRFVTSSTGRAPRGGCPPSKGVLVARAGHVGDPEAAGERRAAAALPPGFRHRRRVEIDVAERQILGLGSRRPSPGRASRHAGARPAGPGRRKALGDLLSSSAARRGSVRISSTPTDIVPGGSGLISWRCARRRRCPMSSPRASRADHMARCRRRQRQGRHHSAVLIDVDEAHVIIGTKEEAEALADWAVEMLDVFLADGFPLAPELETKGAITFAPQQNGSPRPAGGLRGQFLLALVSGPTLPGRWRPGSAWPITRSTASSRPPDGKPNPSFPKLWTGLSSLASVRLDSGVQRRPSAPDPGEVRI
jgi:hypothetical protein